MFLFGNRLLPTRGLSEHLAAVTQATAVLVAQAAEQTDRAMQASLKPIVMKAAAVLQS
jgi:hypothetical protein